MSQWTTIRDNVVDALKLDEVTEELKQNVTEQIVTNALPMVQTVADNFVAKIKEQAANEVGWCKVRDLVVLPLVINGALWLVETALNKTLEGAKEG